MFIAKQQSMKISPAACGRNALMPRDAVSSSVVEKRFCRCPSSLRYAVRKRGAVALILFPTGEDACLQPLAEAMITENAKKLYAYEYSLSLLIAQFLLHLVREFESSAIVPGKSGSTRNELIVGVLSYLNVHYNHASLNETAQYFGYSPAYMSRVIREQTGKTFNTIIAQIQMEQAARLMDSGLHNLTEIAQEIGCFDTSHFNKKFKAAYGISPSAYMENLRNKQG